MYSMMEEALAPLSRTQSNWQPILGAGSPAHAAGETQGRAGHTLIAMLP